MSKQPEYQIVAQYLEMDHFVVVLLSLWDGYYSVHSVSF